MSDEIVLEPEDGEGNTQSLAHKSRELRDSLKKAIAERDSNLDGWQRAKADYINLKNRSEMERREAILYGVSSLVEEILPVLDSIEDALEHTENNSALKEGLVRTKELLAKALEGAGLTTINPENELFNPAFHESVEVVAAKSHAMDNRVTKVHQKGYSLNGRLIRPARVAVGHYQQ